MKQRDSVMVDFTPLKEDSKIGELVAKFDVCSGSRRKAKAVNSREGAKYAKVISSRPSRLRASFSFQTV